MVAPMVLQLKLWESRSSPILDRLKKSYISQYVQRKNSQNKTTIHKQLLVSACLNVIGNAGVMFHDVIEMQDKYIRLIIPAGYHKTASPHLQNMLLKNENLFVKSGCSYLGPERVRDEFDTLLRALG